LKTFPTNKHTQNMNAAATDFDRLNCMPLSHSHLSATDPHLLKVMKTL
jgi:hypothetical protein